MYVLWSVDTEICSPMGHNFGIVLGRTHGHILIHSSSDGVILGQFDDYEGYD